MTFSSILCPELAASFTVAPALAAGDLVIFRPAYRNYDTGCRLVEFVNSTSVVLRVLDKRDFGMKFVADISQVRGAI